jgi:hypothetical protein
LDWALTWDFGKQEHNFDKWHTTLTLIWWGDQRICEQSSSNCTSTYVSLEMKSHFHVKMDETIVHKGDNSTSSDNNGTSYNKK